MKWSIQSHPEKGFISVAFFYPDVFHVILPEDDKLYMKALSPPVMSPNLMTHSLSRFADSNSRSRTKRGCCNIRIPNLYFTSDNYEGQGFFVFEMFSRDQTKKFDSDFLILLAIGKWDCQIAHNVAGNWKPKNRVLTSLFWFCDSFSSLLCSCYITQKSSNLHNPRIARE